MVQIKSLAWAIALALGTLSVNSIAAEQDSESKQQNKIVITGSHIKRIDNESSSPLQVISSVEIERSGATSLAELLQSSTLSNGGSLNNQQTGGFTPGAASYNLRGLRADRTLVLVDGHRMASYPFGHNGNEAFVDLNSIPLAQIESVEILKDGASAVYGSDAISGVVNVITKQEFKNNQVSLKTTQSNGNYSANILSYLGGYSSDKSELMFIVEYQDYDALLGKDTEFASELSLAELNEYSFPGTYFTASADGQSLVATPADGCSRVIDAAGYAGQFCANDWAGGRQLLPENERALVALNWSRYFGDLSFYVNASANQTETNSDVNFGFIKADFLIAATDPRNPISEAMYFSRGFSEFGLQNISTKANNYRALVGLNGLIDEFDFDLSLSHSLTQVDEYYADGWMTYDSRTALFEAVNNGTINPFQTLTQDQMDAYTSQFLHQGKSYQTGIAFHLSGELADWDSGAVYFASGVEAKKEFIRDTSDQDLLDGNVVGLGNSFSEGEREITSLFGEFILPATETLEVNLALRYDNYSDFGSDFNPKASLKYTPNDNLLLRASWGTGFRAPNLFELQGEAQGTTGVSLPNGESISVGFVKPGNPDLDAETSESFNLGLVLDFDRYMFSIDAWQITVEDMIVNLGAPTIVLSFDENGDFVYEDLILSINANTGLPNSIINPYLNISSQKSQGIDFSSEIKLTDTLKWQFSITHLTKLERESFSFNELTSFDYAGEYLFPKNRINSTLSWKLGDFEQSLMAYYIGDHGTGASVTKSQTKLDYQMRYQGENHGLVFSIANLTDEQPVIDESRSWPYFENRLYSPLGRTYSIQWQYSF